jgi:hypothetical protein
MVMFTWKPDMPAGQMGAIAAALDGLPAAIDAITSYRHGADLGIGGTTACDYAIVATFDSVDGWREYDQHPVHEVARAEVIRPWIAQRWNVQFQT